MPTPYGESHPWITFKLDPVRDLDPRSWMLLGEAHSKCQHLAGAPLRPDVAVRLHQVYLSKGIHGTTSIEGNTLSEDEVLRRVQGELALPPSREYLGTEIDNIVTECNAIMDDVRQGRPLDLSPERIKHFNAKILTGLPLADDVEPGEIRTHNVGVARYLAPPAADCERLLKDLCEWLNELQAPQDHPELRFPLAILRAIMAHLYLAWIHPFGDGNGRTARLVEFELLVHAGIPVPAAHLLSDHYNQTREQYYVELDRTSRGTYPLNGFIHYALQGFVDELRDQIQTIREQLMEVTWLNYVHDVFREQETLTRRRQKRLVLALPRGVAVPTSKLPMVDPRVAQEYAGKTIKTITRDVNDLLEMNLVRRSHRGVIANRELIEAFLPVRARVDED